jgi:hypothetical protein
MKLHVYILFFLGIVGGNFAAVPWQNVVESSTGWRAQYKQSSFTIDTINAKEVFVHIPHSSFVGAVQEQAVPVLRFTIGLPSAQLPVVSVAPVQNISVPGVTLVSKDYDSEFSQGLVASTATVSASKPKLRDGLWVSTITIPLVKVVPGGLWVYTALDVAVQWNTSHTGNRKVPARTLKTVQNPRSAKQWGHSQNTVQGANVAGRRLAKENALEQVQWLLRFPIGNKGSAGAGGADPADLSANGIYGVSYSDIIQMLNAQGRNSSFLEFIPIERIQLFGGPQDSLAESMTSEVMEPGQGLYRLPFRIIDAPNSGGVGDGVFGAGDSIYFYASSPSWFKRTQSSLAASAGEVASSVLVHHFFSYDPYSEYSYVYLGIDDLAQSGIPQGKVYTQWSVETNAVYEQAHAQKDAFLRDYYFGGVPDEETGKEWFWLWHQGNNPSVYNVTVLNHSNTRDLRALEAAEGAVSLRFFPSRSEQSRSTQSSLSFTDKIKEFQFEFSVNNATVNQDDCTIDGFDFVCPVTTLQASGNQYQLNMPETPYIQRFDGYTVTYKKSLRYQAGGLHILPDQFGTQVRYNIDNLPAGANVLRINDGIPEHLIPVQNNYFVDSTTAQQNVQYFVFTWQDALTIGEVEWLEPSSSGIVSNLSTGDNALAPAQKVEYLLIAPQIFEQDAVSLAQFRNDGSVAPITTAVVRAEDIYRDFSGGRASPVAIRDFLRYAYVQWGSALRYVGFVGDGHFDYRNIKGIGKPNYIPPYQREYMGTDDFFAILDSGEYLTYGEYDYNIAVGRVPAESQATLQAYIQKVKEYEEEGRLDVGPWRNRVILAADDAFQRDKIDTQPHTQQQEKVDSVMTDLADSNGYALTTEKVYLVDYEADLAYKKPDAYRDIVDKISGGAFITTYFGHGSGTVWADELLLDANALSQLENRGKYPILCSFACTVGRFEQLNRNTLSEVFLLAPHKGAIATVSATRPTYPSNNERLAKGFFTNLINPAQTMRVGDAFFEAKGNVIGDTRARQNTEKYNLLGEPVLPIMRPELNVQFKTVIDTLQALQKVRLSGSVQGAQSGQLLVQVFQGDVVREYNPGPQKGTIKDRGRKVYAEQVSFANGSFETSFIMPRKLSFGDSTARITAYAWVPSKGQFGHGLLKDIAIDGVSAYADSIQDSLPPSITLRPCGSSDETGNTYASGQSIQLHIPGCIEVLVQDSTGIDMVEEADEGLVFSMPGYKDPWHPSLFVEQTGKRIVTRLQFSDKYTPGSYLFKVQSQDILGNLATRQETIVLDAQLEMGLRDVYNAPNPMKNETVFYFKDLAENFLNNVSIRIYNQNGLLVRVLTNAQSGSTRWDGRDNWGRKLANGLYYYQVVNAVQQQDENGLSSIVRFKKMQKLVISR